MKNLKKSKNQDNTNNYFFNKIQALTIACFIVFAAFTACSKDDVNPLGDCGSSNWAQQVQNEITAWNNAAVAYSNDPTLANCNNYKSKGRNYLDALEGVKNCVPGASANEFNAAIQEAKVEISALTCK